VHGAGVSFVEGADGDVVSRGSGRDEDQRICEGQFAQYGEVGVEESKVGAEMYKILAGTGAPDVLTFPLNLPVDDPLDFESGGTEENCSYRTHGFGAQSDGNPLV
jgi:hypothetical protein